MTEELQVPGGVDPRVAAPARMYDYFLGGRNNFLADRDLADQVRKMIPEVVDAAWANRGFHQRAVRWLAQQGIRQFIDIGCGLPTVGNTHEIVQDLAVGARVVYVDHDPLVLAYSAELLAGNPNATIVLADLRDPDSVLGNPELGALIDFSEPAGLMMTAVMHFVAAPADPWGLVARYVRALAPGSYLVLSHGTTDLLPPRAIQVSREEFAKSTENIFLRPRAQVERFFGGLDLVPPHEDATPGVCYVGQWGAEDPRLADSDGSRMLYCGVGRRR